MTGSEKLEIVLLHHRLTAAEPRLRTVSALEMKYGVSRQNIHNWGKRLGERAEEIFSRGVRVDEMELLRKRCDELEKENIKLRSMPAEPVTDEEFGYAADD